ncbi:hypothetical protein [Photobacterium sp. J15]|uniref:hypothetical protein n=1 Tax=Photobacterium sp. J15 TaxID=265901 RepID=UPI0018DC32E9|nr:hypothetical protein [Photobacterium sp. J15]
MSFVCFVSVNVNADTFLNDKTLANSNLVSEYSGEMMGSDNSGTRLSESTEPSFYISPDIYSSPTVTPYDPGFEPTSEAMRENEAKQEADDRLWQAIFSLF